jgi:hypothetical protein
MRTPNGAADPSRRTFRKVGSVLPLSGVLLALTACVHARGPVLESHQFAPRLVAEPCQGCATLPMPPDITTAIEGRVAALKARGGDCQTYGEVLERSLSNGRITVRPYMWREGPNLASAQAKPGGEMVLAREIDPLNVGVRTLDDVLRSVEHEAAHIAFAIPSGYQGGEAAVDDRVNACRGDTR